MDTAVVSEVLLFCLHFTHSLLPLSVLQPGDGATDPFQQLDLAEEDKDEGKKQKTLDTKHMRKESTQQAPVEPCHVSHSHHWPTSRSPPSSAHSPG